MTLRMSRQDGLGAPAGAVLDRPALPRRDARQAGDPITAVLRHVPQSEAAELAAVLVDAGINCIKLPLSDPSALANIETMARICGDRAVIAAGSVLTTADVERTARAGARRVLSPATDGAVIAHAGKLGLETCPCAQTVTEALAAHKAGASALGLFPASAAGPQTLAAIRALLPAGFPIHAFGGITPADFPAWLAAGVTGFGLEGTLYKPGDRSQTVHLRARILLTAAQNALDEMDGG